MGITAPPSSSRRTEWVKLSLFVQVTVVPTGTVMLTGSNLYEGGRLTVFVDTGAEASADGVAQAVRARAARRRAAPAPDARSPRLVRGRFGLTGLAPWQWSGRSGWRPRRRG